jgi:hypothetical protein
VNDGTIYPLGPYQPVSGPNSKKCRANIGKKIQDGGVTFNEPLFDNKPYCEYARGVVMFKTDDYVEGEYKFTCKIETKLGLRKAQKDVIIQITLMKVPKVILSLIPDQPKYPISIEIKVQGSEEGVAYNGTQTKVFKWHIFQRELRGVLGDPSTNDPNAPALQDQYSWVNKTHVYNPNNPAQFVYNRLESVLVIKKGVLLPTTQYKIRLEICLEPANACGYSEITLQTCGIEPRNGVIAVDPRNATMDTARVFSAPGWTADELPLKYVFGIVQTTGTGGVLLVPLSNDAQITTTLNVPSLPVGDNKNGANYTLTVYVDVKNACNAMTQQLLVIQSLPPANMTAATNKLLEEATAADASNVVNLLDNVLSLDPTNKDLQNQVLGIMQKTPEPVTPSQLAKKMSFLSKLVDSGATGENVVAAFESTVLSAADTGCVKVSQNDPCGTLAAAAMAGLGGLLPGAPTGATGTSGGRRLLGQEYPNVNDDFTFRKFDQADNYLGYMVDQTQDDAPLPLEMRFGRQVVNHPPPDVASLLVPKCDTAFCDAPGYSCFREVEHSKLMVYTCCDEANPKTLCNEPPCWFQSATCPVSTTWGRPPPIQQEETLVEAGSPDTDSWFGQWNAYNFPADPKMHDSLSDWDRTNAYVDWHPDVYKRRLQSTKINRDLYVHKDNSKPEAEMLTMMEQMEKQELATVRIMVINDTANDSSTLKDEALEEVALKTGSSVLAATMRAAKAKQRADFAANKMEAERNASQRITRIRVMVDTLAKALITQIVKTETLTFPSVSYTLYIGKTTNLSKIHPSFVFPPAYQVPPDSPDYPTPTNPVTGFSFVYTEYFYNIYYWSDSNPVSACSDLGNCPWNYSRVVALMVFYASTKDINTQAMTKEAIRVFTDVRLFSNVVCLWWDRFAKNTAGGAWSSQGVISDAVMKSGRLQTACMTTNLSDIGIFMDGRVQGGVALIDAATDWQREFWESKCIMCGDDPNVFVIAVLGMLLFTHILLILLGYVMDETRRTDMAKQKLNSRFHYDGDGLTGPLNVDDAIAYSHSDNVARLWFFTLLKVMCREHALISPAFYHEVFTRPQRMLCFCALSLGLLAMNSVVQSRRGELIAKTDMDYVMSGVVSALLIFPIYCGLVVMFNMRPMPVKKRLIKRTYNPREVDLIAQKRKELDAQSNLLPPPGYLQLPPPPPGGIPHPAGETSLFANPPALKLPPLPPAAPGGVDHLPALPPPPLGVGGLPGIPALPSLPGAPGVQGALPPAPSYPPPPKGARGPPVHLTLPPRPGHFKAGPPLRPQIANYPDTHSVPANMIAASPYVREGNMMALADNMGETGGTSQRPLPIAMDAQVIVQVITQQHPHRWHQCQWLTVDLPLLRSRQLHR